MKKLGGSKRSLFFPLLIVVVSWVLLGLVIVFINPELLRPFWYAPFWILVFVAVTWTASLIRGKMTRGVLYGTAVIIFLILRFLGIGNILNGLLIAGLVLTIDIGISKLADSSS